MKDEQPATKREKPSPIYFTDSELREVMWAIHNYTRKGQKRRDIDAQGRAADKVDEALRARDMTWERRVMQAKETK
jgi:hypothetical protein